MVPPRPGFGHGLAALPDPHLADGIYLQILAHVGLLRSRRCLTVVLTQSARRRFQTALSYVLLLSGAALIMIPLVWMVSTSLKEPSAVYTFPPKIVPDP